MDINKIISDSFAATYSVELLYKNIQTINNLELLSKLRNELGNVEILLETERITTFILFDYPIVYADGEEIPVQFMVINEGNSVNKSKLESSLSQTWDWSMAKSTVEDCQATIVISDFMANQLDYHLRVELFNKFLNVFMTSYEPQAINWLYSQKIVEPHMFEESYLEAKEKNLYGHLNVRYFKNKNNELVMDTLGLAALGLPDLQCHFKELDHGQVALILFDIAKTLFEKGDYIEDGRLEYNSFVDEKITYYHEISMANPPRLVIDIDLGEKYKGNRE